jgi:very-short-patch-repair endonuclease
VPGIKVHRRAGLKPTRRHGIAVTSPTDTLVSIAPGLSGEQLERAVNEAVNRGHTDPERLRRELDDRRGAGVAALKKRLDRDTFTLTDSELEQRFLPIARRAGLPKPQTQALVNGYRVDFYWPDLRIVVEADSLRFHRTPSRQRRDSERDHAHSIAGLIPLRFSHGQITFEAGYVEGVLRDVLARRQPRPAQRYAEPLSAGAASAP